MTEWGVVGVLVVLIGMIAAVVSPIIKLNTTIVKLTSIVNAMAKDLDTLANRNADTHQKIFDKFEITDEKLGNHEARISILEHEKEA